MRIPLVIVLCLAAARAADAAGVFTFAAAFAPPGGTAEVEVRFRHDGDVLGGEARLVIDEARFTLPVPPAATVPAMGGSSCIKAGSSSWKITVAAAPPPGVEAVVCRVPVQPRADQVRRERPFGGVVSCEGAPCTLVSEPFLIDGPLDWSLRALVVVPSEVSPPASTLVAFDYADAALPAPLRMFDAPRPRNVAAWNAPHPLPSAWSKARVPNTAAARLLRSVRAVYRDEHDLAQALANAASDPAVAGTISPLGYGLRTWPGAPRAGEPLALWLTASACSHVGGEGFDDRQVRVEGDMVEVSVPEFLPIDFICPGGQFDFVWNLDGLPAGTWRLRVVPRDAQGEASLDVHETTVTVLAGSVAGVRSIPATMTAGLAALAALLAMAALGAGRGRARPC